MSYLQFLYRAAHTMGPAAEHIVGTFDLTKKVEYDDVLKQYDEYFVLKPSLFMREQNSDLVVKKLVRM